MRSNVEVWFPEDDGGSSVQEFRFGAHNYGHAANWVLRDVLDYAWRQHMSDAKLHRMALSILIKQYTTIIFQCKPLPYCSL